MIVPDNVRGFLSNAGCALAHAEYCSGEDAIIVEMRRVTRCRVDNEDGDSAVWSRRGTSAQACEAPRRGRRRKSCMFVARSVMAVIIAHIHEPVTDILEYFEDSQGGNVTVMRASFASRG